MAISFDSLWDTITGRDPEKEADYAKLAAEINKDMARRGIEVIHDHSKLTTKLRLKHDGVVYPHNPQTGRDWQTEDEIEDFRLVMEAKKGSRDAERERASLIAKMNAQRSAAEAHKAATSADHAAKIAELEAKLKGKKQIDDEIQKHITDEMEKAGRVKDGDYAPAAAEIIKNLTKENEALKAQTAIQAETIQRLTRQVRDAELKANSDGW